MEPDQKFLADDQIAAGHDQLADDIAHLRKLWLDLRRTHETLRKSAAAYEQSRKLLLQIKNEAPE